MIARQRPGDFMPHIDIRSVEVMAKAIGGSGTTLCGQARMIAQPKVTRQHQAIARERIRVKLAYLQRQLSGDGDFEGSSSAVYNPVAFCGIECMTRSTESNLNSRMKQTAVLVDRIVPWLLLISVCCFAIHKIVAYDIWWQLKTGEWMLAHGFPSVDPFSYATPDRPWIEMRWLYCVVINFVFKEFGLNSLIVFKTILVLLAFGCLWLVEPEAPVWSRCLGVAGALALAHLRFTIRPELVTQLFLSFTLLGLYRYKRGGRLIWIGALPLVQVLWTNSHTVFVLGPVTIWIFALAELAARWVPFRGLRSTAMSGARLRPLLIVALLSTAACVVNPYFLRGALFPFQLFSEIQAGNVFREIITEFQSPFSYAGFSIFFIRYPTVAVISVLTFLLNWRRPSPGPIALWCAYMYLSTLSERNLSLFGLVSGYCAIINCSEAARDKRPGRVLIFGAWGTRAVCATLALVAIPAVVTDYYYQKIDPSRRFGFGVAKDRFPIRAMAFIDAEHLPGPILKQPRRQQLRAFRSRARQQLRRRATGGLRRRDFQTGRRPLQKRQRVR